MYICLGSLIVEIYDKYSFSLKLKEQEFQRKHIVYTSYNNCLMFSLHEISLLSYVCGLKS